ncbi:sensor histidine kinase [Chitinophaga arvensicola]|nr:histidine kinase [Chitinophaga arvensicola]
MLSYIALIFEKGNRLHLLFCGLLFLVAACIPLISRRAGLIPSVLFCYAFVIICIYTGRWIFRKWLLTGRWKEPIGVTLSALLLYTFAALLGYNYFFVPVFAMNHAIESAINIGCLVFVLIFAGFVITAIRSAMREKINGLRLAEEKASSELRMLQSQVSPHFLFNTLNNMYSLAVNRPAAMPGLLLKLSDLLRYSVYEASQPLVALKEEFTYIGNYIELENIRSSDRLLLSVDLNAGEESVKIAPMVLIVFVENAFKHARNSLEKKIQISITAKVEYDTICFQVTNSYAAPRPEETDNKRYSGQGIDNVIKRLNLLYPDAYTLEQQKKEEQYSITLRLKAK